MIRPRLKKATMPAAPVEEPSILLGSPTGGGDVVDVEKVNLGQVAPQPSIAPLPQAAPVIQQPQQQPPLALPQAKARPILRRLQFPGTTRRRLVR